MRFKVADHEIKLYCAYHNEYPEWFETDCGDDEGQGSPLNPLHWNCLGLARAVDFLDKCQLGIEKRAKVPLGPDYPTGAKKLPPMTEWPQELQHNWQRCEGDKEAEEQACRESWEIEIVPITQSADDRT